MSPWPWSDLSRQRHEEQTEFDHAGIKWRNAYKTYRYLSYCVVGAHTRTCSVSACARAHTCAYVCESMCVCARARVCVHQFGVQSDRGRGRPSVRLRSGRPSPLENPIEIARFRLLDFGSFHAARGDLPERTRRPGRRPARRRQVRRHCLALQSAAAGRHCAGPAPLGHPLCPSESNGQNRSRF